VYGSGGTLPTRARRYTLTTTSADLPSVLFTVAERTMTGDADAPLCFELDPHPTSSTNRVQMAPALIPPLMCPPRISPNVSEAKNMEDVPRDFKTTLTVR
jgi:hypothetical protein